MKQFFSLALALLFFTAAFSQSVPQGMKYQAVARDAKGQILANQKLSLKIDLVNGNRDATVYYSEVHEITSNDLGLFTLVIGEGTVGSGAFKNVPWSTQDIWMQVAIKDKSSGAFTIISSSKLLAVPYAFHAETASSLVNQPVKAAAATTGARESSDDDKPCEKCDTKKGLVLIKLLYLGPTGVQIKVYKDENKQKLLTTFNNVKDGDIITVDARLYGAKKLDDEVDLQVVSPGIALTSIPSGGGAQIVSSTYNNFSVVSVLVYNSDRYPSTTECSVCDLNQNWKVGGNVISDLCNRLGAKNKSDLILVTDNAERLRINKTGDISIANSTESASLSTGALIVNGGVAVAKNLNVGGKVNFGGASSFGGQLHITDLSESTSTSTGALIVDGGTGIGKNLNVGGNTEVTGTTRLKSTLTVDEATTLKKTLDVTGATTIGSTLDVTGVTRLKNALNVDGQSAFTNTTASTSPATGALVVTGGVGIGGDLNVAGATKFGSVGVSSYISAKGLNIVNDTSSYLATFQNTNDGDGDGIKIKLGRAKSSYTIPAAPTLESSSQFADLLNCNIPETQKLITLGNIVKDDAIETGKTMAGIAVSAGNMIINVINSGLSLPLSIPDVTVPAIHLSNEIDVTGPINTQLKLPIVLPALTVPALDFPKLAVPTITIHTPDPLPNIDLPGFTIKDAFQLTPAIPLIGATEVMPKLPELKIPALDIPRTTLLTGREVMPKLPKIDLTSIGIPEIDIASLKFWGLDINICLDEKSSSPLNNSNEFIRFADKNDAQVGSIRGVSVTNWAANYLNPVFFNKLRGAFLSSKADKFHAQYHFKQEISTALASYAKIGVEYSSGNGDYAEWLERSDKMEFISAGDIVSVKGGKITKDLSDAEQVMVVSHAPIMLGNMPAAGKVDLGNSIVFIGQAPVKILGPVASGDFIVGQINTPGYGIAKHQADMTLEDFKLAVGRSWDTDESEGIKMANTVIGIHNSSFLNLIKDLKEKAENNDARLQAIEAKLNIVAPAKSKATAAKNKK